MAKPNTRKSRVGLLKPLMSRLIRRAGLVLALALAAGLLVSMIPPQISQGAGGDLDPTFDGDGKVMTSFGSDSFDFGNAVVIQPDGKIIVAGHTQDLADPDPDFALARYNPDGSLDTTFDGDGKVKTPSTTQANAVALQPDG